MGFATETYAKPIFQADATKKEDQRRLRRVGRRRRLFRAHGLIAKVGGTHRYVVTDKGRAIITALLAARQADVNQLTKLAA